MELIGVCGVFLSGLCLSVCLQVTHIEPWEKGSRKTAGQTGMCGGVSEKYVLFVLPTFPFFLCQDEGWQLDKVT